MFTVPYFSARQMSIVKVDGPPSWSLDASFVLSVSLASINQDGGPSNSTIENGKMWDCEQTMFDYVLRKLGESKSYY